MSFAIERKLIESAFATGWFAQALPIQWENGPHPVSTSGGYVRLVILNGASGLRGIDGGQNLRKFVGVIDVTIFVPKAVGSVTYRANLDTIESVLAHKTWNESGVYVRTAGLAVGPKLDDGDFYQINTSTPFTRDE